jgi:FecR protein
VINGTVGVTGEIRPAIAENAATRIRFSDGSEIALDREARAQVSNVTPVGARIVLSNGRAHTFFVPKPHARWQVAAGPYVVQVTGTIFDVQWSGDSEAFDVWLEKGSVRVSGPLIGDGIAMTHGQHLLTRVKDNRILLDSQRADAAEPTPATPEPEPAPAVEPAAGRGETTGTAEEQDDDATAPSHIPARVTHPVAKSWSRRMARGDFEAVVAAAERRGIESVLAHGSHAELAALADAARYTRRSRLAGRALNAERQRFPETAEGREASFFLGNLAEDGGDRAGAVSWYGRYLREDAAGTYAAQALGRKMLIESRRASSSAGIDAEEYLHRFPSGSYADAARLIMKQ